MNRNDPDRPAISAELADIDFHSPGRFEITNPPASPTGSEQWSSAPFVLGSSPAQAFNSAVEARQHALALIEQARRSLNIYTPDLEPWLYNHSCIQQACSHFLLAHPRNRLRILVGDSSRAVKQGHRLVTLARRLTSNLAIRKFHPDYPMQTCAFLIADNCGVLVRPEPNQFSGHALYRDPGRARQRQRLFDNAWDHSLSDPDLRSFLL